MWSTSSSSFIASLLRCGSVRSPQAASSASRILPDFIPLVDDPNDAIPSRIRGSSGARLKRTTLLAERKRRQALRRSSSGAGEQKKDPNRLSAIELPAGTPPQGYGAHSKTAVPPPTLIPCPQLGRAVVSAGANAPGKNTLHFPPPPNSFSTFRFPSTTQHQQQQRAFAHTMAVGRPAVAPAIRPLNEQLLDCLSRSGLKREWVMRTFSNPSPPSVASGGAFRLCSYNVLCQKTIGATSYLYHHARDYPFALDWRHRSMLLAEELRALNADVFGLQEIQDMHFEQFYRPLMESLGYNCWYLKKSGDALHSDGCGLFVRASRFRMEEYREVDFYVPNDPLLNRGNVAQVARLVCLRTGASLLLSNTHIIYNTKRGDVKLGQIALLLATLHQMRRKHEPVVMIGDWNLEPNSALFEYITSGRFDCTTANSATASGQVQFTGRVPFRAVPAEIPAATMHRLGLSRDGRILTREEMNESIRKGPFHLYTHQLKLASAYSPHTYVEVSTCHKEQGNPDFIFYTVEGSTKNSVVEDRSLRLLRRLSLPRASSAIRPWPNPDVPSDHIPLLAEFAISKV